MNACYFMSSDGINLLIFSELEVSLLVLPFPYIPDLLLLLNTYIQQGLEVELVCRCLFFLLRYIESSVYLYSHIVHHEIRI